MVFHLNGSVSNNDIEYSSLSKFESDYITNFCAKTSYINLNGAIRSLLHQHEMNDVIKMNNGYLTGTTEPLSDDEMDGFAQKTCAFSQKLKDRNIDYLYVTLPHMSDKFDRQLPTGIDDNPNAILDDLNEVMGKYGVNTLDLSDKLKEENMSTYDIFYKTDHHWTTEGGFWAYRKLAEYFENNYFVRIDDKLTDLDNYSIKAYKKNFLGSNGRRTGVYYAGIDDFDIITPDFATCITNIDTGCSGTLAKMMYKPEKITDGNYFTRYTYDTVLAGTCGNWHNLDAPVKMNIVIVGDSMAKAVFPYLALTFENVLFINDYDDVNLINDNYIKKYNPDLIISFYGLLPAMSESSYDWNEF